MDSHNIIGRGEELLEDIGDLFLSSQEQMKFIDKWGISMYSIIHSNFVWPIRHAVIDKNKAEAESISKGMIEDVMPRIATFCSSFL